MISPALQQLYNEHETILKVLERMHEVLRSPDLSARADDLRQIISFFREYGDGFHHGKEEQILFPRLADANPAIETLTESLTDHHVLFREALARAEGALNMKDWATVEKTLRSYAADLTDHISAENDELFVAAEDILSDEEKEKIYFQFIDHDRECGDDHKRILEEDAQGI